MKKNSARILDPAFADYFYSILYGATIEDKLALPEKYQNLLKSERAAKKFALQASMDEKLLVLNYLGIKHFIIISDSGISGESNLKAVLKAHKQGQEYLTLKQVVESGLYVSSNKQLLGVLKMASLSIHTKTYRQELELSRTRYHAKKWDQKLRSSEQEMEAEDKKSIDVSYVRLIGYAADVMGRSENLFNLKESRLKILIFLYPLSHTHTRIEEMWQYFSGTLTNPEITSATKELVDLNHIELHPFSKKREYTISASGITIIKRLKEAVHKLNSFYYD